MYKIIRWLLGDKYFKKKLEAFDKINPERFYVENIRSYFGMSYLVAKKLCEEAVNNGKFDKRIGVECPKCGRIIKSFESIISIQDKIIVCEICASLEADVYEFNIGNLKKVDIYSLHKV